MLIAILALSILNLIAVGLLASRMAILDANMLTLRKELKSAISPQTLGSRGGRQVPTPQELEAARNRIDQTGLAHPGGG